MKKTISAAALLLTTAFAALAQDITPPPTQSQNQTPTQNQIPSQTQTPPQNTGGAIEETPLLDKAAGKITISASLGYGYHFASKWDDSTNKPTGGLGYGVSLGWTQPAGFGLSADYLNLHRAVSPATTANYDAGYHLVTFTPSYRFSFGDNQAWGLRLGVGVGLSMANITPTSNPQAAADVAATSSVGRAAGGAVYSSYEVFHDAAEWNQMMFIGSSLWRHPYDGVCASSIYTDSAAHANVMPADICVGDEKTIAWFQSAIIDADHNHRYYIAGKGYGFLTSGYFYDRKPSSDQDIASDLQKGKMQYKGGTIAAEVWSAAIFDVNDTAAQMVVDALKGAATSNGAGNFASSTTPAPMAENIMRVFRRESKDPLVQQLKANLLAAGAVYTPRATAGAADAPADSSTPVASWWDKTGLVLAPQVALEYDNGLFHGDLSLRYLHELKDSVVAGKDGTPDQKQASGPLALFVGAGFGVNF